ncbi:ABC transporter permease [Streptomyces buecherae]|uniref:ABC transporter permease n=1 Tax=Streptomyces buecherae TaxID=2763006 RepID=UPI001C259E26|nr:ABC transporter permease subunit [Streptomyces buecherae]
MKGLTWVVWRQHRATAWTVLALTAVAACCVGYWFHQQYAFQQENGIAGCDILLPTCRGKPLPDPYDDVAGATHTLRTTYRDVLLRAGNTLLYLPLLVATFIGAPLFARDLESGTHRLVLTQSVSPRRWLAVKLAFAVALTLFATLVVTVLYGWWWHSTWRDFGNLVWDSPTPFLNAGPAAVAIVLLALVLGAAVGLIIRKTLPAMVISLGVVYGALALLRTWQPVKHLWPLSTARFGLGEEQDLGRQERVRFYGYETSSGEKLPVGTCIGHGRGEEDRCLDRYDVVGVIVEYHPASAYWPTQWVLAGICLTVAAALVAGCLWWVGRRTA